MGKEKRVLYSHFPKYRDIEILGWIRLSCKMTSLENFNREHFRGE